MTDLGKGQHERPLTANLGNSGPSQPEHPLAAWPLAAWTGVDMIPLLGANFGNLGHGQNVQPMVVNQGNLSYGGRREGW